MRVKKPNINKASIGKLLDQLRHYWTATALPFLLKAFKKFRHQGIRISKRVARFTWKHTKQTSLFLHRHGARRPHSYLRNKWKWYDRWHEWQYHQHVHTAIAAVYVLIVGSIIFVAYQKTFATPDLTDTWDFTASSNYTFDSGAEASGSTARLKAQNYTSDSNTKALYHFDSNSGTTATDSSVNGNNATTTGSPSWVAGQLNNAISLNGSTQWLSAPDTASLSLSQPNTLEAWVKFGSSFSGSSHDGDQVILDKGAYKLYYDHTSGKINYEMAKSTATTWTARAGNDINGSWDTSGKDSVLSQAVIGSNIYAGLGTGSGDAEVWKWTGSSWSIIGGDGINSSWDKNHEAVDSMYANGTILYVGLGSTLNADAEVWSCDTSTNCTTWTKIGGDNVNSSWGDTSDVYSLWYGNIGAGNFLYAGLGSSAVNGDGDLWRCTPSGATCSTWTKIGGDNLNSGWANGNEAVYAINYDGTGLVVGLGNTGTDGQVYRWNGTAWTKMGGGGSAVNASWSSGINSVHAITVFGGNIYVATGDDNGDAEIWKSSTAAYSWVKIGGDNINSGWAGTTDKIAYSLANDGTNVYAAVDTTAWKWNGTAWSQIAGGSINGSWSAGLSLNSLMFSGSTLYGGLHDALTFGTYGTSGEWTFNGTTWTKIGGDYMNNSWSSEVYSQVSSMATYNGSLYAGVSTHGGTLGKSNVFKYDGTSWSVVGGSGLNSSWTSGFGGLYGEIYALIEYKGNLYAGISGANGGSGELWKYDGTTWSKVGGDGVNSSWADLTYESVQSLAVYNGNLYAGLGISPGDAELWKYDGTTWSRVGGDGINSSWTNLTYQTVQSQTVYKGKLYVGLGNGSNTLARVWSYDGTNWVAVGGNSINSSWGSGPTEVDSLVAYNGDLYAGLGSSLATGSTEVWKYNDVSNTWTRIGGASLNASWSSASTYISVKALTVYNGELYAGIGGSTINSDGSVWKYNGSVWSQVGGNDLNGGWSTTDNLESIGTLTVFNGKLYSGYYTSGSTTIPSFIWSYGDNNSLQSAATTQDTNWHHIAATNDGVTMKIYLDGVENASGSSASSMPDNNLPLLLGKGYGSSGAGLGSGPLTGNLDEIRISDIARTSFTTLPFSSTEQAVTLNSAVRTSGVNHWDTWADSETANGGTITYRLSDDGGTTWKYWNGSAWAASSGLTLASTVSVINTHIATFPATFSGIKWQAVLKGNGNQQVTLNSTTLQSTSDTTPPATNASAITALKAFGGSSLVTDAWTNGSSPYFAWTAGSDAGSGVKGYCLYLGQDNTADPVTTAGLLGASPVSTGGHCQFMVSGTNINTATAGYLASALTSSNSRYYLRIKAMDNAGNTFGTATSFSFFFDNTLPANPAFITGPSGFVNTKAVTLTWATAGGNAPSDGNSGLAGLQYRVNNGTWYGDSHSGAGDINDLLTNDGSYTFISNPDFPNLNEGVNTIYFRTWDVAGNVTTSYVTAAVKINTTGAPSEPQNVTATPGTNTTNSFAFSWSAPATFVGDVNNLTYCYTINTLPSPSTCTFTAGGVTSLSANAYATQPGTNTFYIAAKDESSNINYASYGTATFTATTVAPGMPLNANITDVSLRATSSWRLAISWDPPASVGDGVASYKIYRSTNNVSFTPIATISGTSYIDTGLSQIHYYYKIKACDSTNNCGADSSVVDETPTGRYTSPANLTGQPAVSDVTTRKATIKWNTDRSSDSRVAIGTSSGHYSPSEVAVSTQVTEHVVQLDNLSAGTTYYVKAKWTDEDGNTGNSQEVSFTTDGAPVIKEVSAIKVGLNSAVIQFTAKNATKVGLSFGKSDSFGGLKTVNTSLTESTYTVELDGLDDGAKYFYKLTAYDTESFPYDGNVFTFTTPPRPHITNLRFQPVDGEPTSTQKVTWDTNVASNSVITYGKVGTNGTDVLVSSMVTAHEVVISGLEDNSDYFLLAQSRDVDGNLAVSDKQIFKTALDTRPPKITDITVEATIKGTGAEARGQVVVSWKTDEPSTSQVAYGEGSNSVNLPNKTSEDSGLATQHIVIVSDLPTSKVYTMQPVSKDKAGNAAKGAGQSAIIGRASDNVLTIVLNTLRKVFGF
ncbi:MAG: putative secreted protein containing fibronectin type protein [Candidatus Saccharibacteria bacterium]|nr:putative secreted protein containing fibronectin type protein [Candidatus Saccharibacteria bacterium]